MPQVIIGIRLTENAIFMFNLILLLFIAAKISLINFLRWLLYLINNLWKLEALKRSNFLCIWLTLSYYCLFVNLSAPNVWISLYLRGLPIIFLVICEHEWTSEGLVLWYDRLLRIWWLWLIRGVLGSKGRRQSQVCVPSIIAQRMLSWVDTMTNPTLWRFANWRWRKSGSSNWILIVLLLQLCTFTTEGNLSLHLSN